MPNCRHRRRSTSSRGRSTCRLSARWIGSRPRWARGYSWNWSCHSSAVFNSIYRRSAQSGRGVIPVERHVNNVEVKPTYGRLPLLRGVRWLMQQTLPNQRCRFVIFRALRHAVDAVLNGNRSRRVCDFDRFGQVMALRQHRAHHAGMAATCRSSMNGLGGVAFNVCRLAARFAYPSTASATRTTNGARNVVPRPSQS